MNGTATTTTGVKVRIRSTFTYVVIEISLSGRSCCIGCPHYLTPRAVYRTDHRDRAIAKAQDLAKYYRNVYEVHYTPWTAARRPSAIYVVADGKGQATMSQTGSQLPWTG